jgi:hypothetical protein
VNEHHVARWTRDSSGTLVVADAAGNVVASCSVPQGADRPDWRMLLSAGWCAYPGSEWEEDPPGRWEVAVFQDSRQGEIREG